MNVRRTLQFLSLPAALALGTALVVACSSESPTESTMGQEQVSTAKPFAAPKKPGSGGPDGFDAIGSDPTQCEIVSGYQLAVVGKNNSLDTNGDTYVCKKGGGPNKKS